MKLGRGERFYMTWGLGSMAIIMITNLTEGNIGMGLALVAMWTIGCIAAWIFF